MMPERRDNDTANIFIMGKRYPVPKELTILRAMEAAGYRLVRGCGCRGGFCGACGTVFRTAGDHRLKVGLACQTVIQEDMYLAQIPFFPAVKAVYSIDQLAPTAEALLEHYPELLRCVQCNSCSKVCPQNLEVMHYIAAAQRGDLARVAELSFDCVMCGLCASRCPAEMVQYNVAILARRLYARHQVPRAAHLAHRVREIEEGKFDADLADLMRLSGVELRDRYAKREIEA